MERRLNGPCIGICRTIAATSLILPLGCGPRHRLNGTYIGERPVQVAPGTDPVIAAQMARVKLIVKPDGTASLSDAGVPVEGHIAYGFSDATFEPDSILGVSMDHQPPDKTARYTIPLKPLGPTTWLYAGTIELKPVQEPTSGN